MVGEDVSIERVAELASGAGAARAPIASAQVEVVDLSLSELTPLGEAELSQETSLPLRSAGGLTRLTGSRPDHVDLPAGSIVGEYEVEARIGAGAMGVVFSAHHVTLGRRVALKVIAPEISVDATAIERFRQEARALAQIHHPGIVGVVSFGELADRRNYFVMEWLDGEPLEERLARGRVPESEALELLEQIARALDAAHAHGITHRDLKPANTFLQRVPGEDKPVVKLLDFGLAKVAHQADQRVAKTQVGVVIGTALYISPEQARGPDVDHRTDIYAFGCIAYQLLVGRLPFESGNIATLLAMHLYAAPPTPRAIRPDIAPELDRLLLDLLAKDPAARPTLSEAREAIVRARNKQPAELAVAPRSRSWRPPAIAANAAVAAIACIAIGVAMRSRPDPVSSQAQATPSLVTATPIEDPSPTVVALAPPTRADMPSNPVPEPTARVKARPVAIVVPTIATVPPTPPPVAHEHGTLALSAKPPCEVYIDGVATGQHTPYVAKTLDIGRHQITLVNPEFDIKDTFPVEIITDRTERVAKDWSDRLTKKRPIDPNQTIDPFPDPP